jgi:hypothetical protein
MIRRSLCVVALVFSISGLHGHAQNPPMGWSEWDAYGLTVTEADIKANAAVLADLKQYGWQYALTDAGWYIENPTEPKASEKKYVWDRYGRLLPAANRFPSSTSGVGFKPLADWLHVRGLKFGIHVMPGIPRQAVEENLPIEGSTLHARDAAESETCSWDKEFYVAKENQAGQAYYDSLLRLYAGWGLDYIKLGCVSDHPFHPSGIRQIAQAIRKSGRPIVLSLSPGPPPAESVDALAADSQLLRVSEEHWDFWAPVPGQTGHMVGLRQDFDLFAQWAPRRKPGHWIDGDVLPEGWLGPHPAWGEPRQSRQTEDEQRTEFTLWTIARAPLLMGANLTRLDAFTRSLMTNQEVIDIDRKAWESHPVENLPPGFENARVWIAKTGVREHPHAYIAVFNLDEKPAALHIAWKQLGLGERCTARSVWDGKQLPSSPGLDVALPPHGSALYSIAP